MSAAIQPIRLARLHHLYPEIAIGESDYKISCYRSIVGHAQSMAYDFGRLLAINPPHKGSLGVLYLEPFTARCFSELEGYTNACRDESG